MNATPTVKQTCKTYVAEALNAMTSRRAWEPFMTPSFFMAADVKRNGMNPPGVPILICAGLDRVSVATLLKAMEMSMDAYQGQYPLQSGNVTKDGRIISTTVDYDASVFFVAVVGSPVGPPPGTSTLAITRATAQLDLENAAATVAYLLESGCDKEDVTPTVRRT